MSRDEDDDQLKDASIRLRYLILGWLAAVTTTACDREAPRLLTFDRDTLVLYGPVLTPVPVNVVDATGAVRSAWGRVTTTSAESILSLHDGRMSCRRPGFSEVTVVVGDASQRLMVECTAAKQVHALPDFVMDLRDPPRSLSTTALLHSGGIDSLRPVDVIVSDTHVVKVRNGEVIPYSVGRATVTINYGGVGANRYIEVRQRIFEDTLILNAGESRTWELSAGRYDVAVIVGDSRDLAALKIETEGANCARSRSDDDMIHCVVYDSASVVMRNTSARAKERTSRAAVSIVRLP